MSAGTNTWQRVDNTGCFPWVLRVFLLAWSIGLPYAVVTGSKGWFAWSLACALGGVWLTVRSRNQGALVIPDMSVNLLPQTLAPGQQFIVTLQLSADKGRSIRWWRAEMMAGLTGDDPKPVVSAEFAVDPQNESAPVSELQMVLEAPAATVLRELKTEEWFVRVTVESDRGRLESGRVPIELVI